MAKCLYGSLFDWIVLQLNHALLAKKEADKVHRGYSIGVLDIFGFEDFGNMNRFEYSRHDPLVIPALIRILFFAAQL